MRAEKWHPHRKAIGVRALPLYKEGLLVSRIILGGAMCFLCGLAIAAQPAHTDGETIFFETGVEAPDRAPTWYASMVPKPYTPVFEMLATQGTQDTQGRYYPYTYTVTLKDLVRFHGRDCEGTISAANSAWVAFKTLFPDGIIDRSVLRGISGESPCWSDAVALLTGARLQFGTLGFFRDKRYSHAIILYREDTKVAVLATWKEGINNVPGEPVVLPGKITWKPKISMKDVEALEAAVKRAGGNPTPHQMDLMRHHQWTHINEILERPLTESYQVKVIEHFDWEEWIDPTKVMVKTQVRNEPLLKSRPYRGRTAGGTQ